MSRARDRAHLIRTNDDELVSSEVGIMHPASVKAGMVLMILLCAGLLGVMIWASVVLADERPYYCQNSATAIDGNYMLYYNRAAEPYSGSPARVLTGVVTAETCTANCDADSDCRFFTLDSSNAKCYMYSGGVLPNQYAAAAVPGPTTLDANVYVKLGSMVAQERGSLRDGNQTLF